MIRKKGLPEQEEFWVSRDSIRAGRAKTFYDRLADDLEKEGFGDFVRELCAPFYHAVEGGRPPIDPEVYFKMLMAGYFENIPSERGIAARCEDSLSLRRFLRYDLTEATPDHSSLSVIRNRLPEEVYAEVFAFSLRPQRRAGLLPGEKIGLDSTTMEADASLEKLVRREDGKSYADYVAELAAAEGIDPQDKAAVAEFDRKREGKKTSNREWVSPNDRDAAIGPRKDGAWDMIHKVENAVDLDSGAILSCEIQSATKADSTGMATHMETAADMVDYVADQVDEPPEAPSQDDARTEAGENDKDNEQDAYPEAIRRGRQGIPQKCGIGRAGGRGDRAGHRRALRSGTFQERRAARGSLRGQPHQPEHRPRSRADARPGRKGGAEFSASTRPRGRAANDPDRTRRHRQTPFDIRLHLQSRSLRAERVRVRDGEAISGGKPLDRSLICPLSAGVAPPRAVEGVFAAEDRSLADSIDFFTRRCTPASGLRFPERMTNLTGISTVS